MSRPIIPYCFSIEIRPWGGGNMSFRAFRSLESTCLDCPSSHLGTSCGCLKADFPSRVTKTHNYQKKSMKMWKYYLNLSIYFFNPAKFPWLRRLGPVVLEGFCWSRAWALSGKLSPASCANCSMNGEHYDPKICCPLQLKQRCYVSLYYKGARKLSICQPQSLTGYSCPQQTMCTESESSDMARHDGGFAAQGILKPQIKPVVLNHSSC
jgi:hypothetical protein